MVTNIQLTDRQREFLNKVIFEKPYNKIEHTIREIIKTGWYTEYEQDILNSYNREWIFLKWLRKNI